jgi:hypothetical protein
VNFRELCWLATAMYALHVIEELVFDSSTGGDEHELS